VPANRRGIARPVLNPLHLLSWNHHLIYTMPQVRVGQGEDRFMRVTQGLSVVCRAAVCLVVWVCLADTARGQEQPPPPPPDSQSGQQNSRPDSSSPAPVAQTSRSSSSSSGKRGHSHASDFLVIGTVFTDKAYALPGARIRARRTTEKKFRWETYTNSRGEFALRVPQGNEYEIVVIAKGFADQTGSVSSKSGISEDNVVYRMQPASGDKK
jgi:hypothetical protein